MRVGFVQWPASLDTRGAEWARIAEDISRRRFDVLVTNELPFGEWIAESDVFDSVIAEQSVATHAIGLKALQALGLCTVISSRPIWSGDRLLNEAIVIEQGAVRAIHSKQYFPAEPGWHETSWYRGQDDGFRAAEIAGCKVGVLLCTELMFNEHARHYGRDGVALIAVPRAVGASIENWLAAGKMAAIVSGSYVVSSNRCGPSGRKLEFGGVGFAYHPDGSLLSVTSPAEPLQVIDLDPTMAAAQQLEYPCYVRELPLSDEKH